MTREELMEEVWKLVKADPYNDDWLLDRILELVENELALANIRPPWMPEPEEADRWKPGGDLFNKGYKMLTDHVLSPEQREVFLKMTGARCASLCAKCSRPGLAFGDDAALCWYHQDQVLDDPPFEKPYPPGTRYGLLKRSNLEKGDG